MKTAAFVPPDEIRTLFSTAMSGMYRRETPQYATLLDIVRDVNDAVLAREPLLRARLDVEGGSARLGVERHGAIRVGTARELANLRRLFAVMGMEPVGYYDLSVAGVPVHATAFRPVRPEALARNPFRVFTSLLRLECIEDESLREMAAQILASREIFTPRVLSLIGAHEARGGLDAAQAKEFVAEALETFRWHGDAHVTRETYERLHHAHRLVADVVCFRGPHINHLTPRTLDIDAAQAEMTRRGLLAKNVIEGPPRRRVPILLRQTSFRALEEEVLFAGEGGTHTARFGEIEQRGIALTRKGRALYDTLLAQARDEASGPAGMDYPARLAQAFEAFPDDLDALRRKGLGFFRHALAANGEVTAEPITYEDFLPVSAAGIFQSNLGGTEHASHAAPAAKAEFEAALGAKVLDELRLYEEEERASLAAVRARRGTSIAHALEASVVPQGANAGLVGAGSPDGTGTQVVLSSGRLRSRCAVDAATRTITADAGILLHTLNDALAPHGLCLPIDLGAEPSVAGMVAANTGGARLIRWGDVRCHLFAVEAVLFDRPGETVRFGKGLRKDNTGFDLKQLFAGTSGAVGIVTRATFEVRNVARQTAAPLIAPSSDEAVMELLADFGSELGDFPTAFEGMRARWLHLRIVDFGHIADGGLHFNLAWPAAASRPHDARAARAVRAVRDAVYGMAVNECDGSCSAEHGIGPHNIAHCRAYTAPGAMRIAGRLQSLRDPARIGGGVDFGARESL